MPPMLHVFGYYRPWGSVNGQRVGVVIVPAAGMIDNWWLTAHAVTPLEQAQLAHHRGVVQQLDPALRENRLQLAMGVALVALVGHVVDAGALELLGHPPTRVVVAVGLVESVAAQDLRDLRAYGGEIHRADAVARSAPHHVLHDPHGVVVDDAEREGVSPTTGRVHRGDEGHHAPPGAASSCRPSTTANRMIHRAIPANVDSNGVSYAFSYTPSN
jgi:hypothetical protein